MSKANVSISNYQRLTIDKLCNEGCVNILEFFLGEVNQEYVFAANNLRDDPYEEHYIKRYCEIKDFIESNYFSKLTGLNGKEVFAELEVKYKMIGVAA